ncbi:MAG: ABC transporter ATP-binding protein [Chloroflexi bacterium]|nr:ABC transporter ATP-binding protein [Chloroflexota bacterium]
MLRIEKLSVSYGTRRVLREVSLEVNSGEVLALIGPNGAGKSTLVRAVSGVIPVESGGILSGDFPGTARQGRCNRPPVNLLLLSPMQRARSLAVVPQAASMPPAFTVWETVLMGRTPHLNFLGQVSAKDEGIARLALQKVDALDLSERRVGELSGGEQQRVLLARALAQSTPILLLDEPTSNLDLHYQVSFMETMSALAHQDNLAVLVALHDLNLAARYADRVALLVDGEIKAMGTPQQVLTPELISMAYHLPVQVIPHPFADVPLVLP